MTVHNISEESPPSGDFAEYYPSSGEDFHDPVDPTIKFFYKRRSITALVLTIFGLIYVAFFVAKGDTVLNVKM